MRKERIACDCCLNESIKQAGMILFDEFNNEFLNEMMNMEEIEGITSGDVYLLSEDIVEELGKQQKEMDPEFLKVQGGVPWFYMNLEGVDVCKFNIKEGKRPEEWKLEEGEYLIYLGNNFKNIEVGTKYYSEEYKETYVVGGILDKGTDWIYDDIYRFESITDSHYVQNLDSMVVRIGRGGAASLISGRNTYVVKKGYHVEDVEPKLQKLAEKYDMEIRLARLTDILDENEYQYSHILKMIRTLALIIIITALFVLEHTQFSQMINDTEYFGIFYANGASTKDLILILVGENIFKIMISFFLAVVSGYSGLRFIWFQFQPGIDNWRNAKTIYFEQAILPSFAIGLLIICLATLRPILWMKKKSPVELIQEYKV